MLHDLAQVTVGISTLVWGTLSDRYGRRLTLLAPLSTYLAFTVACVFAPSITALILLRAAQGFCVARSPSRTESNRISRIRVARTYPHRSPKRCAGKQRYAG